MRLFSAFLSTILTPLVAVMPLRAELAASVAAVASANTSNSATTPDQGNTLKIRLAEDSKATVAANSIVNGYSVLVTDSGGLPVPDAAVAIRLPDEGVTGFFINGEHSAVAYTDSSGVAKFPQINWGSATGSLSIRVTAVKGDLHSGVLLEQTIVAPQSGKSAASAPVAPFPSVETPFTPAPSAPAPHPDVQTPEAKAKTPGVPASIAAIHSGAAPDQLPGTQAAPASDSVSVVNTSGSKGGSSNTKKWVILGAVLGAAGIGAALALAGKGGGSTAATAASTTTSIGTPTVSVGH